ncbi:hypothetical protein WR164_05590 [Philodulcilactobacillus myokoensis]|uniref:Uncharacterized protein n=1 Tax=Philodulcilactobacillus myokoensis TaxID=2929573 RepID=A0A9W6ES98_9LACO|nr:hypothetical protein [Philodulcilactobacillus myokoensis]GLB46580.1 hypothetical protein WR164_05590 [Philodulcilactobacillus myokoensis]
MTKAESIKAFLNGSNRQSVIILDNNNEHYLSTATPFAVKDYMIYRPANADDLKEDLTEVGTEKIKPFLFYLEENDLKKDNQQVEDAKKKLTSDYDAKVL